MEVLVEVQALTELVVLVLVGFFLKLIAKFISNESTFYLLKVLI